MTRDEILFLKQLTERLVKLEKQLSLLGTHETTAYPGDDAIYGLVGGMFSGNTETGASVVYQSSDHTIDVDAQTAGDARYGRLASTNSWTGANTFVRAGVTTVERTTAATNTLQASAVFKATSSGAMADGFGTGFQFLGRDTDNVDNVYVILGGVRDGADDTGRYRMFVYKLGVAQQVLDVTADGLFGFNQGTPAAVIDALQATLGNAVMRLQSTATNDDPTELVYQNRVATTNATVTTLHTITIASATSYLIEADVLARRTGGASGTANDSAGYVVRATVKDVSGTATIVGAVSATFTAEDQAAWDCTIDVTGATARVRVTGAASNNVTWHGTIRVYPLST